MCVKIILVGIQPHGIVYVLQVAVLAIPHRVFRSEQHSHGDRVRQFGGAEDESSRSSFKGEDLVLKGKQAKALDKGVKMPPNYQKASGGRGVVSSCCRFYG